MKPYLAIILTLAWSIACVQAQFTFTHIGTGETGSITPNSEPGSYTFIGGGDDIWDVSDSFDFAHETISGDFDVRVRVESLEFTATWTKAGLMARDGKMADGSAGDPLRGDARMVFNRVTPTAGANDHRYAYRTLLPDSAGPNGGQHEDGGGVPAYPNAWLRLVRAGSVFTGYSSADGLNWTLQGSQNTSGWQGGAASADQAVGLAVSRHSGADPLATAEFRDFGHAATAIAAITTQPATQTIEEGFSATLRFTAPGGLDLYDIQWRKGGVDIAGANGISYTTPALSIADSGGAYSVAIRHKSNGSTATSADAIITVVPDVTKPVATSIGVTAGIANRVVIVFSEPVNQADAENLANYNLTGATASGATLQADNKTVHLATSPLNVSSCKELTVSGVRDRASTPNTMDSTSSTFIYAEGVLRYNEYTGIGGGLVSDLTANAKFPNSPDVTSFVSLAENPAGGGGQGDNYGGRLVGYLTPSVSGSYTFYISADDNAVLYLSTDENPANKVAIATEPVWSGFRTFTGEAGGGGRANCSAERPSCNISLPINLTCGTRYYVEGLWKEGGGGDHMSIAWQPPGTGVPTEPIPSRHLSPLNAAAVTLAADLPADTTLSENQNLVLSINITAGTPTWHIQWYKNGTAIPGATSATYTIENAKIPDSGTYHATIQNGLGVATSRSANVNIIVDTVAPSLVSAAAPAGNDVQFDLVYSEPVNEADAEDLTKYSLPGVTLNSATLQADNKTVRFTTSTLYGPGCEQLTVNNIRDRAIPPNTLASATIGVLAAKGSIRYLQYNGIAGVVPVNLTADPKFPNAADRILNVTQYENPAGSAGEADNYGAYFQGYVHPPVSGQYRFYLSADDGAVLYLSTDENPANKIAIAGEPIWSGFRQYTGGGAGGGGRVCPGSACNISEPVTLQAGCKYYTEFIYKEGGGGDFGSVAWQLPGGAPPALGSAPIQAAFLSPYEVAATIPAGQPASQTVMEGRFVTLSAAIGGSPNLTIQWYRDGAPIAGANGLSVTVGPVQYPEDNGAVFHVVAQNSLGTATSESATLTVLEDTEPPDLVAVAGSTTLDRITATYNEIVDELTAGDEFSYIIEGGTTPVNVIAADLLADGKTVLLVLDPSTPLNLNSTYTVTVGGIADFSGNVLDADSATFHSVVEGCGGIVFEAYNTGNIGNRVAVSLLTTHPTFPNNPDFRTTIPGLDSRLAYPTDAREDYGARMRGVYVPPYSGQWVLYLRSDDASELWFNPNGIDPAGKVKVQEEVTCCRAFEALPTAPMDLIGGRPYYIEVLYKEGGGGDYAQVAARPVGSADPLVPVGARDVGQFAEPGFSGTLTVNGPTDQSVTENRNATFSVSAESSMGLPICYQWFRDGVAIAGANGNSYSLRAALSDNGAVFTVRASIVGNVVDSPAATLNVTPDVEAPQVASASGTDTLRNVLVRFNEVVESGTAGDEFNYTIPGLDVTAADLLADGQTVKLVTSLQTPGTVYTVTVSGVTDIAASPNPLGENSSADFTAWTFSPGFLRLDYFAGLSMADNVLDTTLLASPNYPDNPDQVFYMSAFDTRTVFPDNSREGYGARVSGVYVPPTSGNWLFYLGSDDSSRLFLNVNGYDPAGNVMIVEEPACCGPWTAHVSGPQALTGGSQYSIAGIYKEGTGGDYLKVAAGLEGTPPPPDNPSGQLPVSAYAIPAANIGVYTDPTTGASGNITQQPADVTACINPLVADQTPATLSIGVDTAPAGVPSHIQWQRLNGADWVNVASGSSYSFVPSLTDNGAKFRAVLYVLGLSAPITSGEATLSVFQANTPPAFTLGASNSSAEDAGPQSAAGFASGIAVHSIPRTPVAFQTAFNSAAGITLYGVAAVADGVLKLTTPVNSVNGAAAVDAPVQNYESIEVAWKSYIGGGAGGGADGYTLNIGDNIPGDPAASGAPAEEGHPSSDLTVSVDTFNNAELRNPDEGVQIKWGPTEIAFQNIPKDNTGDGNYLRKSAFVDAKLTVDSTGLATLVYDGNTISGQIPGYTGIRANRAVFWARTGGANDNQWIDDLDLKAFPFDRSSAESGQQVTFEVSNSNPGLFSAQPAISPDGTLTYTAAPDASGEATVTVVARDDGGILCNGDDVADAKTFTITVTPMNDCPVATAQSINAPAGRPVSITLGGTDIDGDALTASPASNPQHGTLAVSGGVLTYTAEASYRGADSFTFTVSDGTCTSEPATVSINVVPANPPVCVANIAPADCGVTFPNSGKLFVIAPGTDPVCLVLDGSASSDPDGDPITITWVIDLTNTLTGPLVSTCLPAGCHIITMTVNDGTATCQTEMEVCVVTPSEAVEQIISLVESTPVERKNKRPLIVSLKAAKAAFEKKGDHMEQGAQMLEVFRHKVRAQISRQNPGEAATFDAAADDVIKALACSLSLPPQDE